MTLNDAEKRAVDRWRRDERCWKWARWPAAFGAIGITGGSAYQLVEKTISTSTGMPNIDMFVICAYSLLSAFGSIGVGCVALRWNGDTKARMILKILDEMEFRKNRS